MKDRKFDEFYEAYSNNDMNIFTEGGFNEGDWIVQDHKDYPVYAIVIGKLKNGSDKVIKAGGWGSNKASQSSTKEWYPAPKKVDKSKVPAKFVKSIEKKMSQMGVSMNEAKDPLKMRKDYSDNKRKNLIADLKGLEDANDAVKKVGKTAMSLATKLSKKYKVDVKHYGDMSISDHISAVIRAIMNKEDQFK
jgi:hypothetical protein